MVFAHVQIAEMLASRPDVDDAIAWDFEEGGPFLVLVKPNVFCSGAELRDQCAASLPDAASRIAVVLMPDIPQPAVGFPDPAALLDGAGYVYRYDPPATPTEQRLVEMWNEVLGRPRTGALDDFLDLGGDSVHAIQLIGRIGAELGVTVDLVDFFDAPSVRAVAELADALRCAATSEEPR
jgi:acyl carrier protein